MGDCLSCLADASKHDLDKGGLDTVNIQVNVANVATTSMGVLSNMEGENPYLKLDEKKQINT